MPRVAVVQLEPSYMDPTAGLARIEELTAEAAGRGPARRLPRAARARLPALRPRPVPAHERGEPGLGRRRCATTARTSRTRRWCPGPSPSGSARSPARTASTLVVGARRARPDGPRPAVEHRRRGRRPTGRYLGKHRKLVGVMHERLIFNRGGRRGHPHLRHARRANVGVCICFENHQPLYRRALGRLGEEIHCALWTGPAPRESRAEGLDARAAPGARHRPRARHRHVRRDLQPCTEPEPTAASHGSRWSAQRRQLHHRPVRADPRLGRRTGRRGSRSPTSTSALIDDARLVWNAFGDDVRDDLFGPGPRPAAPPAAVALADPERRRRDRRGRPRD